MKKILVTSAGSNNAIGVAKALKSNSQLILFGSDSGELTYCAGNVWFEQVFSIVQANHPDFKSQLKDLCSNIGIDLIIPIHDLEVEQVSKIANQFSCRVACAPYFTIKNCNDKRACNSILRRIVPVPVFDENEFMIGEEVIIKPNSGVSSRGHRVLKWTGDSNQDTGDLLIQKMIFGKEFTVDLYKSYLSNEIRVSVRERLDTKDGQSTKGRIVENKELAALSKLVATSLGLEGANNIQWMYDGQDYWFIEVNPRFAGGGVLTYLNGYNMAKWTVDELLFDKKIDTASGNLRINATMSRFWSEYFDIDERSTNS